MKGSMCVKGEIQCSTIGLKKKRWLCNAVIGHCFAFTLGLDLVVWKGLWKWGEVLGLGV